MLLLFTKIMNVKIELRFADDRVYLNYFDYLHGRDVNCQIEDDGRLMVFVHSASENEELESQLTYHDPFEKKEITLKDFVELVHKRAIKPLKSGK